MMAFERSARRGAPSLLRTIASWLRSRIRVGRVLGRDERRAQLVEVDCASGLRRRPRRSESTARRGSRSRRGAAAVVASRSPGSVMLLSWTRQLALEAGAVLARPARARASRSPGDDEQRGAVDPLERLLHPLAGQHAAVVVLAGSSASCAPSAALVSADRSPMSDQRQRQRRLRQRAASRAQASRRARLLVRGDDDVHVEARRPRATQPQRHRARPSICRHQGCARAADDDVADAVRAREVEQRRRPGRRP